MSDTSLQDDEPTIAERLEAYHEALLASEAASAADGAMADAADLSDAALAGAQRCLLLLERVRKQSDPRNSDWLFGAAGDSSAAVEWREAPSSEEQTPRDWEPPEDRIGRFQIERRIGEGGFGVVFLARDPHLDRRVALKLPRPESLASSSWRNRFFREAEAAALLEHPQIVPVYEAGQAGSLCYIVQAWCDGLSLDHWLAARTTPVAPRPAARLIAALADAVQHAHSRGVLHRDIKPANILLETPECRADPKQLAASDLAGVARLSDFGLARIADHGERHTVSGAILGTPAYMPPEQAEGRSSEISAAADIYALGAVLYELLAGRPPFDESSLLATLDAVRHREPPSLRRLNSSVPLDLAAICHKCLEKDPARRYPTAHDLSRDLRRFLAGEVVVARAVSPAERLVRWCRRRPALASLTTAVVLLVACLIGGLAAATWLLDAERQSALDARELAERSELRATRAAYDAHLAESRALRRSGDGGQRLESLAAIGRAVQMLPKLDLPSDTRSMLRQEAMEAMRLVDLAPQESWPLSYEQQLSVAADRELLRYAYYDGQAQAVVIRRFEDNAIAASLPVQECEGVWEIQFSRDGKYLSARLRQSEDRAAVQVWRCDSWEPLAPIEASSSRGCPHDFSPDGKWLAVALPGGAVGLYELPGLAQVRTWDDARPAWTVRFDPASKQLGVYRRGRLEVLDVATGKVAYRLSWTSRVNSLDFIRDGSIVAAACDDRMILLWAARTNKQHPLLMTDDAEIARVRFDPQGYILAASTLQGTTRLWMMNNFQPLVRTSGVVTGFSPDGKSIGLGSSRQRIVTADHKLASIQERGGPLTTEAKRLSLDDTGRLLAVSNSQQLSLIDLEEARLAARSPVAGGLVQFDPAGKSLLAMTPHGLYRLRLRRLSDATQIGYSFAAPQPAGLLAGQRCLTASDDGRRVAAVVDGAPPKIVVCDTKANTTRTLGSEQAGVRWLSLSASGRWLAAGGPGAQDVLVWDAQTGALVKRLEARGARAAFSPDESALLVDEGWRCTLYRTDDWQPAATSVERPVSGQAPGPIAFSADGRLLAIAGNARQIQLRDAHNLQLLVTLDPASVSDVESILFDRAGTRLIACNAGPGLINVWDLRAIRTQLAAIGLDLPGTPPPPLPSGKPAKRLRVHLDLSALDAATSTARPEAIEAPPYAQGATSE